MLLHEIYYFKLREKKTQFLQQQWNVKKVKRNKKSEYNDNENIHILYNAVPILNERVEQDMHTFFTDDETIPNRFSLNRKEFYEKKMQQDFGYLVDFSNSLSRFFMQTISLFDNTWMCTINEAIIMQRYRQV